METRIDSIDGKLGVVSESVWSRLRRSSKVATSS